MRESVETFRIRIRNNGELRISWVRRIQRIQKYEGAALFKLPSREGHFYKEWKHSVILKFILKKRLENGNVYVCERHFLPHEIEKKGVPSIHLFQQGGALRFFGEEFFPACGRAFVRWWAFLNRSKPQALLSALENGFIF